MRFQDVLIEQTSMAVGEVFKYAKQVPADKLEWQPMDTGRSVIDICRELAQCPTWAEDILNGKGMSDFSEEAMAAAQQEAMAWKTPEDCEAECRRRLESFFAVVRSFPDERLNDTYTLPFDGGQTITMRENMEYPLWNFHYHQGQIAYIQTLFGDRQMYW